MIWKWLQCWFVIFPPFCCSIVVLAFQVGLSLERDENFSKTSALSDNDAAQCFRLA